MCVLTVLGLVRFLASVSQLLRWLYVLLLRDINRVTEVTMATSKDLTSCHPQGGVRKESAAAAEQGQFNNESGTTSLQLPLSN